MANWMKCLLDPALEIPFPSTYTFRGFKNTQTKRQTLTKNKLWVMFVAILVFHNLSKTSFLDTLLQASCQYDILAQHSCCTFVDCTFMKLFSHSTTSQQCSVGVSESTHCRFQETSSRLCEICDVLSWGNMVCRQVYMKNDIYKALFKYSKTVHMSHFSTAPGCNNELKKKKRVVKKNTHVLSVSFAVPVSGFSLGQLN